jgi:hypothetical protein
MNTASLIKHYHNPSLFICIAEAREIIEDRTTDLRLCKSYHRRHPESVTQQEKEEEDNINHEIYYYETTIFRTQQTYQDDPTSCYGYSLRRRTPEPSVTDSDSNNDEEEMPAPIVDPLEKKINAIEGVVYQLIGGLFNQRTQIDVIDNHLAYLSGTTPSSSESEQSAFPTTRQGDANEFEIQLLKQQVAKLEGTVNVLIQLLSEKIKKV